MIICKSELIVFYVVAVNCMDVYLNMLLCSVRSLDGIVSIVTRLWAAQPMNCGSITVRDKRFFSS
jgi:hypothetical protein